MPRPTAQPRIAVLGAGLQGTTAALELARRGCAVDLVDRGARPITQAGLQNEGKLHLGFVYGNDPSLRTARRLAAGSLRFLPLIRRWSGPGFAPDDHVSRPYLYAVPADSMLAPEAVAAYCRRVEACVRELADGRAADPAIAYPGLGGETLVRALPEAERRRLFPGDAIAAAFATNEVAVDPVSIAGVLRRAVAACPGVSFVPGVEVEAVERRGAGFVVATAQAGPLAGRRYDHVVNALWDGRLRLDQAMGLAPGRNWLWRYKAGLRLPPAAGHPGLASVTFVLGPYGDAVHYRNGHVYLSWYPAGLLGRSSAQVPPAEWIGAANGAGDALMAVTVAALARLYPAVGRLWPGAARPEIVGGVIFAWGATDIDDPASELHQRHDVGVASVAGYHTVNTGKYCLAPALAMEVADRIAPVAGRAG